jgi:hypothetical protein
MRCHKAGFFLTADTFIHFEMAFIFYGVGRQFDSLQMSADTLRVYCKLKDYEGILRQVRACILHSIEKGSPGPYMIPVNLRPITNDKTKLDLRRQMRNQLNPNSFNDIPVKPDEFLDILKLAYPGCTVEYKQQTRLDGTEEGAFFISW